MFDVNQTFYVSEIVLTVFKHVGEFDDVLDSSSSKSPLDPVEGIQLMYCNARNSTLNNLNGSISLDNCEKLLEIENLTVQTPTKATLVRELSLEINEKDHILVCILLFFLSQI